MRKNNNKSNNNKFNETILGNLMEKFRRYPLNNDELKTFKEMCIESQVNVLSYINRKNVIKTKKINVLEHNNIFQKLVENIDKLKDINIKTKSELFLEGFIIETKNKREAKFTNCLKISLDNDCYVKISSTIGDSIEISVIYVNYIKRKKGIGRILMETVIEFCKYVLGYQPRFVLECVGSLETEGVKSMNDISKQISFFRKFGFRVENKKHYPQYVMMASPKSNDNFNEDRLRLVA